jgi:hypothetical protein
MKTGTALATALFALVSFPILAQQPTPATPPGSPATQQNPPATAPAPPNSPAAAPETAATPETAAAVEFRPVTAELVSKLDSKTAKTGDNVVVQTKSSVKTADGTEIPKGSKLMGHVIAVQPSASGTNSQVALLFDHVELKGGQSLAVHSQIQSIAPSGGADPASAPTAAMSTPQSSGSPNPGATAASTRPGAAPQGSSSDPAAAPSATGVPAAGTVVATNGNIAIRTTSIPGVLLANNTPGQQDPRMARASSILLGAKKDIQLDGGTQMVVGVSAAGGQ